MKRKTTPRQSQRLRALVRQRCANCIKIFPKGRKNTRNIPRREVRRTLPKGCVLYFTEQGTCTASSGFLFRVNPKTPLLIRE